MEERMTICNMSIEGGARVGYVNPDETTFDYLRGRPLRAAGRRVRARRRVVASMASDAGARYDDEVEIDGAGDRADRHLGHQPRPVGVRSTSALPAGRRSREEALAFMGFRAGQPIAGTKIDVAFIGSCTNARLSDLREAARMVSGHRVAPRVQGAGGARLAGGARAAEREGLDQVFRDAGFEWRGAGCSMCLAMNPDQLVGREICASSSNRNFKGRQGSPDRPHAADEPGDGRGGRDRRRGRRRAGVRPAEVAHGR